VRNACFRERQIEAPCLGDAKMGKAMLEGPERCAVGEQGKVIRRDEIPAYEVVPGSSQRMITGEDHGLGLCIIMAQYPPGTGPGPHRHPNASAIYVAEGFGVFTVGDDELAAEAGDVVVVPAMAWHSFRNTGDVWLRVVGADEGARHDAEFPDSA
jgi:quercetin dioxygenase-like cupin family protein